MLLIFPNTFEYFFIAYEVIRLRFDPSRVTARFWLVTAVVLWVFVKLPQEYWIHIAQRDMTDTIRENPLVGVALAVVAWSRRGAALRRAADSRCPRVGLAVRCRSSSSTSARDAHGAMRSGCAEVASCGVSWPRRSRSWALLCIIFASILPERRGARRSRCPIGVVLIVVANTAISMRFALSGARRDRRRPRHGSEPSSSPTSASSSSDTASSPTTRFQLGIGPLLRRPDHADPLALRRLQADLRRALRRLAARRDVARRTSCAGSGSTP